MLNRCTADMFLIMWASVFSRFTSDQREWIWLQTTKKLTSIVSAERKWFRCQYIKSHILITLCLFSLAHSSQTGGGLLWGGGLIEPLGENMGETKVNKCDLCRDNKQTGVWWCYHSDLYLSIQKFNLDPIVLVASPMSKGGYLISFLWRTRNNKRFSNAISDWDTKDDPKKHCSIKCIKMKPWWLLLLSILWLRWRTRFNREVEEWTQCSLVQTVNVFYSTEW